MPVLTGFSGLFVHIFLAERSASHSLQFSVDLNSITRILDLTQMKLASYGFMLVGLVSCGLGSAIGIFGLAKNFSVSQMYVPCFSSWCPNVTLPHFLQCKWFSTIPIASYCLACHSSNPEFNINWCEQHSLAIANDTYHSTTGSLVYIYHKMGEKLSNILPRFAKVWGILVKCNVFGTLFCLLTLILAVSTPKSSTWFVLLMPLARVYSAVSDKRQ